MSRISKMCEAAKQIENANTGYSQYRRWALSPNRDGKILSNKEGDCSSICGLIAKVAGYSVDLSDPFYTGTARERLVACGFEAIPFRDLSQLKRGDFVLNTWNHIVFMYDDATMFEAGADENGDIIGGVPGDQTGMEVRFRAKYLYRLGWDWILRPPKEGEEMAWSGKMASPVEGWVSMSWRGYEGHAGMDIACPENTEVHAAFRGRVVEAGESDPLTGRTGKRVRILNPDGESQYYGHLNSILCNVGDWIEQGEVFCLSGATGNVSGPHLHFETWAPGGTYFNGRDFDPQILFDQNSVSPGSSTGQVTTTTSSKWYTRKCDGDFGKYSTEALQNYLRAKGFYGSEFLIDGQWGTETNRAVQKWLSSEGYYDREADGEWGEFSNKGLQAFLRDKGLYDRNLDNVWGYWTQLGLQKYLAAN